MLKLKRRTKKFSLLLVLTMLATMFMGLGTASALGSYSVLSGAPSVDTGKGNLGTIFGVIDAGSINSSHVLTVSLPQDFVIEEGYKVVQVKDDDFKGVQLVIPDYYDENLNAFDYTDFSIKKLADNKLQILYSGANQAYKKGYIYIYLAGIYVPSGSSGDINATLSSNGGWGSATLVVAKGSSGAVTLTVDNVNSFAEETDVTLTVAENMAGALANGTGTGDDFVPSKDRISLHLPSGFKFESASRDVLWGSNNIIAEVRNGDARYLDIYSKSSSPGQSKTSVSFNIRIIVDDPSKAKYGDLLAAVTTKGNVDVTNSGSLLVGVYGDYGIKVEAESTPDVYSGQLEQKIGNIIITENAPKSLVAGRTIILTLPSSAKWGIIDESPETERVNVDYDAFLGSDGRSVRYKMAENGESDKSAGKITFEDMEIVVSPDATGDIEVEISGSAGVKGKVKVAKAVPALDITSAAKDVKLGVQDQAGSDIVIKEAAAEILRDNADLLITLPSGVKWSSNPTVSVTDGDLDIDSINSSVDESVLRIPIDGQSSTASTITLTNVKYTVDRSYPEGKAVAKFGGDAIVQVNVIDEIEDYYGKDIDDDDFDFKVNDNGLWPGLNKVAEATVANCVTPAPSDQSGVAVFTIGSTSYTFNGVSQTMDTAPYIQNDRTFMPVRYVANALGVADTNIIWDNEKRTVTLVRDDKVVQMTIGSNILLINGAAVTMDTAPEIKNSRTMLPASWVAQAFGGSASWDAATQQVTIIK